MRCCVRYVPLKKSWKPLYHNKEHWEDLLPRPATFCGERFRFPAISIAAVNARNTAMPGQQRPSKSCSAEGGGGAPGQQRRRQRSQHRDAGAAAPVKVLQRRGSNVRQGPATPGQQRRHARICTRSCSARSVAIRINGDIRRLKLRGTASPRAPRHRSGRLARKGHGDNYLLFARTAKNPGRSIFEAHSRTGEGPHSWTKRFRGSFRTDEGAPFE